VLDFDSNARLHRNSPYNRRELTKIGVCVLESTNKVEIALVLYVGWGTSIIQQEDKSRVFGYFGSDIGRELLEKVQFIIAELGSVEPNWNDHDLHAAAKFAAESVVAHHPEITEEGRSALEWIYSWWWK
jgi:glucose-6-phosphate dehydrogenase assembly protein OpcA